MIFELRNSPILPQYFNEPLMLEPAYARFSFVRLQAGLDQPPDGCGIRRCSLTAGGNCGAGVIR